MAPHGRLAPVLAFTMADGKITEIDVIAQPDRCREWSWRYWRTEAASGPAPCPGPLPARPHRTSARPGQRGALRCASRGLTHRRPLPTRSATAFGGPHSGGAVVSVGSGLVAAVMAGLREHHWAQGEAAGRGIHLAALP
ncbi:hypothetical protein QBC98_007190 [Kitasatospora acidiphila]